ncbi:MAG: hypothetical protein CBB71_08390 [Rhodopirellula sp. TMED11]|nr:MAG: hypothetical protein CBB71_08390 [Rhodopirellula sp. TMED11]
MIVIPGTSCCATATGETTNEKTKVAAITDKLFHNKLCAWTFTMLLQTAINEQIGRPRTKRDRGAIKGYTV